MDKKEIGRKYEMRVRQQCYWNKIETSVNDLPQKCVRLNVLLASVFFENATELFDGDACLRGQGSRARGRSTRHVAKWHHGWWYMRLLVFGFVLFFESMHVPEGQTLAESKCSSRVEWTQIPTPSQFRTTYVEIKLIFTVSLIHYVLSKRKFKAKIRFGVVRINVNWTNGFT